MGQERADRQRPALRFILFALGPLRLGVRASEVVEIVRMPALTALPRPVPIVEGVVNYRGRIAAVLDARARFRLPPKPIEPEDQLIVASLPERLVALRVDRAFELVALDPDEIAEPGDLAPHDLYVAGVAKGPDGLFVIHDLRTFLSAAEAEELDRALETVR